MEHNAEITGMSWLKENKSKLAALWFLRGILEKADHMWIAVNSEDCANLGDIIVHRDGSTYSIHIKHKDTSTPILEEDFITSSNDFYLKNYFPDVAKLKKDPTSDIKSLGDCNNIYRILFTNGNIGCCEFLEPNCEEAALVLLNTDANADAYTVSPEKLPWVANSSSNLYLLANQINDANELIIIEMRKILEHFESARLNVNDIVERFTKYITDWAGNKPGERLTKGDVLCKLTALMLHRYKVDLSRKKITFHEENAIWGEIVGNKTLTIVDNTEEAAEFLFALCVHGKLPLLLEISSVCEYKHVLRALVLSNYNLKVIVLNNGNERLDVLEVEDKINIFRSLRDLDETARSKLLKRSVKLEGRRSVVFGSVIDENMLGYVECSDIIRILLDNFSVGSELEPLPARFIERTISKVLLEAQVLDKVKDEVFLIQECSENELKMLSVQNLNVRRLEEFAPCDFINPNCRIIISRADITREDMKKFQSTIHYLKVFDAKHLEWQASSGPLYKVEKYKVELEDAWGGDLDKLFHNATNIISVPDAGKTLFMDYVARRAPVDKWVLKLNLSEHREYFQKRACKSSHTEGARHLNYFANSLYKCESELSRAVFQKFATTKDVIVLLDGLDEVMASYKDEVMNVIDSLQKVCKLWVATPPQLKCFLEEECDAFSVALRPLPLSHQLSINKPQGAENGTCLSHANTPLHLALLDPTVKEKTLKTLIFKCTELDTRNSDGDSPLHLALSKHHPQIAKLLIDKGADVNMENKKGQTVLHLAAHNGYHDIILQILPKIVDIDRQDHHGRTALFYASLGNKIDTLRLLVSRGSDIGVQDVTGETVLHRTVFNGHDHIVAELLCNGADVEKRDHMGHTPLFDAVFGNHIDTLKLLISNGADVNVESVHKEIPLHNAAYGGYVDIVSELLSNGIDADKEDDEGNTPLFFAVFAGELNTLKLLLSNGASVNHENGVGEVALHRAALYGNNDIVTELVLNGVDVNKQNHFGFTPLHLALLENELDTVKLLISNGARLDVDSKDGEIAKLLREYLERN